MISCGPSSTSRRAYHWLVSTDIEKRRLASEGRPDMQDPSVGEATYEERKSEAMGADMRVYGVAFVDLDTAIVSYRVYYMGQPSPIANVPLTSLMLRRDGRWVISSQGICQLSVYADNPCDTPVGPEDYVRRARRLGRARHPTRRGRRVRVLADPVAGVDAPRRWSRTVRRSATRSRRALPPTRRAWTRSGSTCWAHAPSPDRVQLLYSLVADGGPRLETPYPVTATVVQIDGTWRVLRRYACGLTALAGEPCALPVVASTTTTTEPAPSTTTTTTTTEPAPSTIPTTTTSP